MVENVSLTHWDGGTQGRFTDSGIELRGDDRAIKGIDQE